MVEDAAIAEMGFLSVLPALEHAFHRHQRHAREAACVALQHAGVERAVILACDDLLRLQRVEKLQIAFGSGALGDADAEPTKVRRDCTLNAPVLP